MSAHSPEFEGLVAALLEKTATSDQQARLAALIQGDPALRAEYVRQVRLDALLTFTESGVTLARPTPAIPIHRRNPFFRSLTQWAALLIALAAVVSFWLTSRGVLVEVVSARDAHPAGLRQSVSKRLSLLKMDQGDATLRLPSGVLLDVVAPLEIRFLDPMHVRLVRGRVIVDVGEKGKGFVMDTPHPRVVDLGTRFGVDASDAGHTDVVVIQGAVELYQGAGQKKVATLTKGEGVRVENSRRMSRIVSLSGLDDSDSWIKSGSLIRGSTISSVSDNLSGAQPSLRNFYRIVPAGLRDGTLAFADEADLWQKVPPSLVGADLVRTFAVDAFNWWLKLSLTIERPSEVFVFVDTRNPVPAWLRADFKDTGETMWLDLIPSQTPGRVAKQLEYAIWKRVVETPGKITLGAPYPDPPEDRKSFKPNRMYGVASKPLP
jgi:ferric-dicitrate binding protein FerR (iron transport regulator)